MSSAGWKTLGTILQITGSFVLAMNLSDSWEAYWTMFAGSAILLWQYIWDHHLWPLWMVFCLINVVGICRWTPW